VLSHHEACQSVDTISCSPSTVRRLLWQTVKCLTSSTIHSPTRCSIRSPPHRRLIQIQYTLRSNKIFPRAITAVVNITSGSVSICEPTWRMVLQVWITLIDLYVGMRNRGYHWYPLPAVTARNKILHMERILYCQHCRHRHQPTRPHHHTVQHVQSLQHAPSLQPAQSYQPRLMLDKHLPPHHCYHRNNWHSWCGRLWTISHDLGKPKSTCNPFWDTLPAHRFPYDGHDCGSSHLLNAMYLIKHSLADSERRRERRVCFTQRV